VSFEWPKGVEITSEVGHYSTDSRVEVKMPIPETKQLLDWFTSLCIL